VSEAAELRRTFDERWEVLGLADTAVALRTDVTLRPDSGADVTRAPQLAAWTRPDPRDLPRLALSFTTTDAPAKALTASGRADLEVHALLGEGGMGKVHAAHQRSLDRDVAIKMVKAGATLESAVAALLREAVVTGRLEHPGIVPVHALGLDERGAPVLVMKRVEGVEWRALLDDPNHPGWATRGGDRLVAHVEILMQVCQAVHFAHSRDVAHCDIKPENVMLGEFGEVYLVDWGVAMRLDDPATRGERAGLVGTPAYMAPELVGGRPVGPFTDVYLLGATLHQVLTGRFRHEGRTVQEALLSAFCSEPFEYHPSVPSELAELCNRATSRDPSQRPATALEFRRALSDFLRHRSAIALADEATERLGMLQRLLEAGSLVAEADALRRAYQLASESRFGFTQSLKEWPENEAAQHGLAATIRAAVELELEQGHLQTAEALLAEIPEVPEELERRMRRARREYARARAEDDRLRAMAHDMDARVSQRERAKGLAALSGAALAVSAFALSQPNPARIKPEGLLTFAVVLFVIILAGVIVLRKRLLTNAFNRRGIGITLLASAAIVASRAVGMWMKMPAPLIFAQDLFLLAGITASVAVVMLPWLWPLSGMFFASALLCLDSPGWSPVVFSLTGVLMAPLIAIAIWKHRLEADRARAEAVPESTLLE